MPKYRQCPSCLRHTAREQSACAHCGAEGAQSTGSLSLGGRSSALAAALGVSLALGACGAKEEPKGTPAAEVPAPAPETEDEAAPETEDAAPEEEAEDEEEAEAGEAPEDDKPEDSDQDTIEVGEIQPAVYGGPPVDQPEPAPAPPTPPSE